MAPTLQCPYSISFQFHIICYHCYFSITQFKYPYGGLCIDSCISLKTRFLLPCSPCSFHVIVGEDCVYRIDKDSDNVPFRSSTDRSNNCYFRLSWIHVKCKYSPASRSSECFASVCCVRWNKSDSRINCINVGWSTKHRKWQLQTWGCQLTLHSWTPLTIVRCG